MIKKLVWQDQVAHRACELFSCDLNITDRLALDLFAVDGERNGHGAEVFRLRQRIKCARFASVGELIAHLAACAGVECASGLDELLLSGHVDQFLRHLTGEADGAGQLAHLVDVFAKHCLKSNVTHHHEGKLHIIQRFGRRGSHDGRSLHIHVTPQSTR